MADSAKTWGWSVLVALAAAGSGCAEARDGTTTGLGAGASGAAPTPGDDEGEDSDEAGTDDGAGSDDDGGGGGAKLDVPGGPETPSDECATIERSTTIADRPSDIIVIADDAVSREFVRDGITNLLPGMESEGVFDATVVLLAHGEAPEDPDDPFSCGEWDCRGAASFEAFHVIDEPISPDSLLSDLLALQSQWTTHLRTESWKHIWVMTTRGGDPSMDNQTFLDSLAQVLDADTGVSVYAVVMSDEEGGIEDPNGYAGLVAQTDGVYSSIDFNLFDFQDPMIERIHGTSLACHYEIPEPPQGLVFDRDKVNVIYDAGEGTQTIGRVDEATDCLAVGLGWYYDDPLLPTEILLCPASCGQLSTLTEATIEIEFGCDTIPAG